MRRSFSLGMFFVALLSTGMAHAAPMQSFSADIVSSSGDGEMAGKMYFQNGLVRMEMAGAVTITRSDLKLVWVIMPGQPMYMEQPMTPSNAAMTQAVSGEGQIERKALGNEIVNGRNTDKFEVTYRRPTGQEVVYEWIDPAIQMPIKMVAGDGTWKMEYRNVKVGPLDASLFEVPAGYQKMQIPGMPMSN